MHGNIHALNHWLNGAAYYDHNGAPRGRYGEALPRAFGKTSAALEAAGGKRVEQGGVQPHSQGDTYPVIIIVLGSGDHIVQLGGVGRRCTRSESEHIAREAKRVFDSDGFGAAQNLLKQAAI